MRKYFATYQSWRQGTPWSVQNMRGQQIATGMSERTARRIARLLNDDEEKERYFRDNYVILDHNAGDDDG